MTLSKKYRYFKALYFVVFALLLILFIGNIFLDTNTDEFHYLATTYRFYLGDAMLVDDWSPEQMNAVLLLPFFTLYHLIVGSNTGIVLYFRFLYLIMKVLVFFYCYRTLKINEPAKMAGLMLYFCFTPYNVNTLSYNTIPISMFMLIFTIVLKEKQSAWDHLFTGIFLAIAVLSNPFCLLLYIAYVLIVIITNIVRKFKAQKNSLDITLHFRSLGLITLGAALVALVFAIYIFSNTNLTEILRTLPHIIAEPDHDTTILEKIQKYPMYEWNTYKPIMRWSLFVLILTIFDRKREKHRYFLFALLFIGYFFGYKKVYLGYKDGYFYLLVNMIMFLWVYIGLMTMIIFKKLDKYFLVTWCGGMIFAFCAYLSTNTVFYATTAAASVLAVFTIMRTIDYAILMFHDTDETSHYKVQKGCSVIISGICICFIGLILYGRLFGFWEEAVLSDMTAYNSYGPTAGLYTSQEKWDEMNNTYHTLDSLEIDSSDTYFCGNAVYAYTYMYLDSQYGTPGTPFFHLDYKRLNRYYDTFPERFPTVIFYGEYTNKDLKSSFIKELKTLGYTIEANEKTLTAIAP